MITKVTANSPDFQARLKVKRKIPKELSALLENAEGIFPDNYIIKVKNNWIINTVTESGKPIKKGNFDVQVIEKQGLIKKNTHARNSYSWIKHDKENKNNFLDIAVQIYESLYNLKDKMFKKV